MSTDTFSTTVQTAFDVVAKGVNGQASGPLHMQRVAALNAFTKQGIPTTRHEEWKYTNVMPFIGLPFSSERYEGSIDPLTIDDISQSTSGLHEALEGGWMVAIINGRYEPDLSSVPQRVPGLTIEALTDELVATDSAVRTALGSLAPIDRHPFVAVNAALTHHGVVIRLDANITLERTIHIAIVNDVRQGDTLATPRILVLAGARSSVDIVESHHTIGSFTALDISVTECVLHPESAVRYTKIVDAVPNSTLKNISSIAASAEHGSRFTSFAISLGASFVRNDLLVRLIEPASETYLYGASVLGGSEYADNHTVVDHAVHHCHSEELYKGLYDGSSIGVFNGKIFVRPQAQKTTAYQSNHTILLSDKAQVNAKPQLEIWADDVKCSHGATSGQLNEEAIFYLRSRGIDADKARALMTYAFVAEVLEHMDHDALRVHCEQRIAAKLGAEPFAQ
ncbi:MAG TPA: Fe-S cluster assembly protein SufD [Candidatus Didemnitutus sp.]|nr:Fe-S cluster assembly protein SufD [Candidatus Didemnitutus sp.]